MCLIRRLFKRKSEQDESDDFQPRYRISQEGVWSLVDSSELLKTKTVKRQLAKYDDLKKRGIL